MASMPLHASSGPPKVLVVDDEPALRQVLDIAFRRQGFEVVCAPGVKGAIEALQQNPQPFPLVITDLMMPDGTGMDVLTAAKARSGATEVIVMTAYSTVDHALDAMKKGAYDFVTKPFSPAEMLALSQKALEKNNIQLENQSLKAQISRLEPSTRDLFTSPAMAKVGEIVEKTAAMRTTVLITGESGTGKERVARAIHERSDRAKGPFLVVNCGALPEALMESELFGHEKGSFTGAGTRTLGLFREAKGGTVLLDEVGELPQSLQVKLLRVLQERRVRPVGSSIEEPVDIRILAATNRDVETDVREKRFREDLYYRLNVIRIELPPLRQRTGEVPRLAQWFIQRFANEMAKDVRELTPEALRALDAYSFPGNVRELENMMERAVALASGPAIGLGDLPAGVSGLSASPAPLLWQLPPEGCVLDEVLGELERRLILQALERAGGVRKAAAKTLGITFRSLRYRLTKHGLDTDVTTDEEDDAEAAISGPGALSHRR